MPLIIIMFITIAAYAAAFWEYDDHGWAALWAITAAMFVIMVGLFIDLALLIG